MIEGQRSKGPTSAKVCHHDLEERVEPGCPGAFTLAVRHRIAFRPTRLQAQASEDGDGVKMLQSTIGSAVPTKVWESFVTKVAWCVKWCKKGILPVAPRVLASCTVEVPAGHSLFLS